MSTAQPRKRRSEAAIIAGIDPFDYLCARFGQYHDKKDHVNAERMALELLPYIKPKLKQIDANLGGSVSIRVRIGGTDDLATSSKADEDDEAEGGA